MCCQNMKLTQRSRFSLFFALLCLKWRGGAVLRRVGELPTIIQVTYCTLGLEGESTEYICAYVICFFGRYESSQCSMGLSVFRFSLLLLRTFWPAGNLPRTLVSFEQLLLLLLIITVLRNSRINSKVGLCPLPLLGTYSSE